MPRLKSATMPEVNPDFIELVRWENKLDDHQHQVIMLRQLADDLGLDFEERVWLSIVATAYSHEGSTWTAFSDKKVRSREKLPSAELPIAPLRRNLFGGRITKHFQSVYEISSLTEWLDGCDTWDGLLKKVSGIWGNGNWASYTTAEVLCSIAGLRIEPDETGFLLNPGPKKSMEHLGLPLTDVGVRHLVHSLRCQKVDVPIQCLESIMCYWNGLLTGKFYIGRSIDRQQSQILQAEAEDVDCSPLWKARRCFPRRTLGEVNGWDGLDRKRLKHYRDTGELLKPWERRR